MRVAIKRMEIDDASSDPEETERRLENYRKILTGSAAVMTWITQQANSAGNDVRKTR